jgi:hypothetical protein
MSPPLALFVVIAIVCLSARPALGDGTIPQPPLAANPTRPVKLATVGSGAVPAPSPVPTLGWPLWLVAGTAVVWLASLGISAMTLFLIKKQLKSENANITSLKNSYDKIGKILEEIRAPIGAGDLSSTSKETIWLKLDAMSRSIAEKIPQKVDRKFISNALAESRSVPAHSGQDPQALSAREQLNQSKERERTLQVQIHELTIERDRLREQENEVKRKSDRLDQERLDWEAETKTVRAEADHKKTEAREDRARAETERAEAQSKHQETAAQAKVARSDREGAEKALDESRRLSETTEVDRTQAEKFLDDARRLSETTEINRAQAETIREYFWPAIFLDGGALSEWRKPLEAKGALADSAVPLLINSLHRFKLLRDSGVGKVTEELLQEIGRQAYRAWAEEGLDSAQQTRRAEEWTRAFRDDLGLSYEFGIVKLGQPKDNTWMSYPYGAGSIHVARVETWYVKGPRSTLKAIVE